MNVTLTVFETLRVAGRAMNRAEIRQASGLTGEQVKGALRALLKAGVLLRHFEPYDRCHYSLIADASPPAVRGRFLRSSETRLRTSESKRAGPAQLPAHSAAPSAVRVVVRGIVNIKQQERHRASDAPASLLDRLWKKRP